MSRRGFANPEYLIVTAILCVLIAVIVPPFLRARQRSKDRWLIVAVNRVRDREDAFLRAGRGYMTSATDLVDSLHAGVQIETLKADTSGWSVVVVDTARGRRCAMFDGADLFRPSGEVGQPREMACW